MDHPQVLKNVITDLESVLASFRETGLFMSSNENWKERKRRQRDRVLIHDSYVRKFTRLCAREYKVPFLYGSYGEARIAEAGVPWQEQETIWYAEVTVPNRKKVAPLISSLLLVAHDNGGRWFQVKRPVAPVRMSRGPTVTCFYFYGEEGKAIFENWCEQLRSHPDFRRALNLPTEGAIHDSL